MKLLNIHNQKRKIFLFCRNDKGELEIKENNEFFPYYYEEDPNGQYTSFDGKPLRKIYVSEPKEVAKQRTSKSYESDIRFTKRYILDKVDQIEKCPIKYAFIDIEVLADELPNVNEAKYPISCIGVYNSFTKQIKQFYLEDYPSEWEMIASFIIYMRKERFDLWLSWNVKFDYNYLYNRVTDFAEKVSWIGLVRYGEENILYPAGISIIDYLQWDKKATLNRRKSYALDDVAIEEFKETSVERPEFGKLTRDILRKNRIDLERMARLEEKKKYIDYFDEIRRLSKVDWEDLLWNSRTIDMLLLAEAKKRKVVLPMKPKDNEKEEFKGAFREAFETGRFKDVSKYDLSSAYPNMIYDFCLDPSNIIEDLDNGVNVYNFNNSGKSGLNQVTHIERSVFTQNPNALLPSIIGKLVGLKAQYKGKGQIYDAIKTVVNSAYGVMGNRFFRLYDKRVASATTYLVRSLLQFVIEECNKVGNTVIYADTDSVFVQGKDDISDYLNELIIKWAKQYGKDGLTTQFGYEGTFSNLLIIAKCRYDGILTDGKKETKGIEAKRKDSTVFMKKFQEDLIKQIHNGYEKETIIQSIKGELAHIRLVPLEDIAFPCKLARKPSEYKTEIIRAGKTIKRKPYITVQALENAKLKKRVGERFYYIYCNKDGKSIPIGFDEKTKNKIKDVNWQVMTDRNIYNKAQVIFECMGWWTKEKRGQKFSEIFKEK